MVSARIIRSALALAMGLPLFGQSADPPPAPPQVPASSFNPDTKGTTGLTTPTPVPKPNTVTPEVRGDIFMARKMYREAIEVYKSLPETAVMVNKTGIAYHQMLELDTAMKYYKRAVKLDKHYAEALNNLGTVYYAKRSYRRAIGQYKKALRQAPLSASIWSNLGTAEFARKKYKEAMVAYEKALSLDPEVFEHRSTAGVLLQERTVEERAKFHYYQAKLYAKAGMNDRALLYLRKALEEGFKDRDKIKDEPEFSVIKDLPEFQEIITTQQRVL
jgi:tetratricopeptide (TPR) repeat protein